VAASFDEERRRVKRHHIHPSQFFIFFIISMEFGAYVFTRQVVNVMEWLMAWRGHKRVLRRELKMAESHEDWVVAAKKLDEYLGFDEWKETEEDSYFDTTLVSLGVHADFVLVDAGSG
jgi:hypothetical protein